MAYVEILEFESRNHFEMHCEAYRTKVDSNSMF